jgi:hypothetical protein
MISPSASRMLVESILVCDVSSDAIGSEAFTVSRPTTIASLGSAGSAKAIAAPVSGIRASVRMSDLLDAFKACLANELVWIEDFRDDEVEISRDLFEVLEAFAEIRRQDVGEI